MLKFFSKIILTKTLGWKLNGLLPNDKKYIIAVCVQILDEKNNLKDVVPDELKYAHVKERREQFFDTCTYILDNLDKNLHLKDKK